MLADSFELYANAYERSLLLRDFYGKEAQLGSMTAGSEEEKERSKKGMKGLLDGADKERRKRVMGAVKDNLVTMYVLPEDGLYSVWALANASGQIQQPGQGRGNPRNRTSRNVGVPHCGEHLGR